MAYRVVHSTLLPLGRVQTVVAWPVGRVFARHACAIQAPAAALCREANVIAGSIECKVNPTDHEAQPFPCQIRELSLSYLAGVSMRPGFSKNFFGTCARNLSPFESVKE
jgi:hypothetical protein